MNQVDRFAAAAASGDVAEFIASLDSLDWRAALRAVSEISRVHPAIQQVFGRVWFGTFHELPVRPPGGVRLRTMFRYDLDTLVSALRVLLPQPSGDLPTVVYRAQSVFEYAAGITGFSWSQSPMVAESYARHPAINSSPRVIVATFATDAIIGQPAEIEHVLDPRLLVGRVHLIHTPERLFRPEELGHPDTKFDLEILQRMEGIAPKAPIKALAA